MIKFNMFPLLRQKIQKVIVIRIKGEEIKT